jgi:hypothetical protein
LAAIEKIASNPSLWEDDSQRLSRSAMILRKRLTRAKEKDPSATPLRKMTPQRRHAYEDVFSLIYACAGDTRGAKELVDRVLARLKH